MSIQHRKMLFGKFTSDHWILLTNPRSNSVCLFRPKPSHLTRDSFRRLQILGLNCTNTLISFLIYPYSNKPTNIISLLQTQNSCWMKRNISRSSCLSGFVSMESVIKSRIFGSSSSPNSWINSLTLLRDYEDLLLLWFQPMVPGSRKNITAKISTDYEFYFLLFSPTFCVLLCSAHIDSWQCQISRIT